MEKIRLSKAEKQVLRLLGKGIERCPCNYPAHIFAGGVDSLERKGLAVGMWASGHELVSARLSDIGRTYLALNPKLGNPIDWKWAVSIAIGALTLLATILIACSLSK